MTTFNLIYTIEEAASWRSKEAIKIKSNLADDKLIECEIAKSLVDYLKKESATLEPDKFLLTIAETQKRGIETILEELTNIELQAKANADKVHEILLNIEEETENKYSEIETKFSATSKRFNDKMKATAENIKNDLTKLSDVEAKLTAIDSWKLEKLTESLKQLVKLVESDKDLVKLVLDHKSKTI